MEKYIDNEFNDLSGIIKFKPEITYNTSRTNKSGKKAPDGIEIRFGSNRPTPELREKLKAHGFKFSERQSMWYALDAAKARELVEYFEDNESEADDTQYEKRYLWAKVGSVDFYKKLTNYTEFMISGIPPQYFRNKKQLEAGSMVKTLIYSDQLKFKKFYNKIVGEDGEEREESEEIEDEESDEEPEEHEEEENENEENKEVEPDKKPTRQKPDLALVQKLKDMADGMQKQIDAKLNSATSRQRPTAKRLRVAAGMRQDGYYLLNIQKVLYALSKAHQTGQANEFNVFKSIRTKSQVELLNKYTDAFGKKQEDHYLQSVMDHNRTEFRNLGITNVYDWSLANGQRFDLLERFSDRVMQQQTEQQRKIEDLEIAIKSKKIDGFFPTPKKLIDELIAIADIKTRESILEPSAGKGDILDALSKQFSDTVSLSACEVNFSLIELLKLKGYDLVGTDFLHHKGTYDKIIMNPPFENGKDIDHVLHALTLLKKGGRVVAIMGEGVFFRSYKKDKEFRDLLFQKNAFISDKIEGAFKDAFNQTGITVRIVAINDDGLLPDLDDILNFEDDNEDDNLDENDTDQLELEALAEIELLKMELELKKKRKPVDGLGTIDGNTIYPEVWDIH